jgi:hypothetical protein
MILPKKSVVIHGFPMDHIWFPLKDSKNRKSRGKLKAMSWKKTKSHVEVVHDSHVYNMHSM